MVGRYIVACVSVHNNNLIVISVVVTGGEEAMSSPAQTSPHSHVITAPPPSQDLSPHSLNYFQTVSDGFRHSLNYFQTVYGRWSWSDSSGLAWLSTSPPRDGASVPEQEIQGRRRGRAVLATASHCHGG